MGSLPTVFTGGYPDPGAAVLPAGIISAAFGVVCVYRLETAQIHA